MSPLTGNKVKPSNNSAACDRLLTGNFYLLLRTSVFWLIRTNSFYWKLKSDIMRDKP